MAEPTTTVSPAGQSIFISYSSSDRQRVTGLGLLLEALGHKVFLDHKTIMPGRDWKMSLQKGLEQAEILLVFWTKHSAASDWVQKEYEYFYAHHPERMLVPVVGDETPLGELLKTRQRSDFLPLINELLEMKRSMEKANVKPPEIQEAIIKRLQEAGIDLTKKQKKKLLRLFAPTGFLGLAATPLTLLQWGTNTGLEAIAQFSAAQLAIVGAAAISGAVVCGVVDHMSGSDQSVQIERNAQTEQGEKITPIDLKKTENKKPEDPPVETPKKSEPEGLNRGGSNECARINCDCDNILPSLLSSHFREKCQETEAVLKNDCKKTGKVAGQCAAVTGPSPWPK